MFSDILLKKLGDIVDGNLTLHPPLDGRWPGSPPQAIARPGDREQISEILRVAQAERFAVSPTGSMTKQHLGGIPQEIDLLLSLERMNRITDYQPADLTATVDAGVRMADLSAALNQQNQMLPLDPPFGSEATVGGVIATNGSGPRRLAYGTARDMVLGVHFVTADGTAAKSGGKVVKNVAGYDVAKLLIGSLGSLGIVTEVTFKTFPVLPASATLLCGFETAADALRTAHQILHSQFPMQSLDLLQSSTGAFLPDLPLSSAPYLLATACAGGQPVVERTEREIPALLSASGPSEIVRLNGETEADFWRKIRELTPSFLAAHPDGMVIKSSVVITRVEDVVAATCRTAAERGMLAATLARVGNGIVYSYLWLDQSRESNGAASEVRCAAAATSLLQQIEQLGGRAIVEWAPVSLKRQVNIWGTPGDDFSLMKRLKTQFDPHGILNPGRFYGGI
jgi:glycolate oxidase FAD binding subunit